jgi:perosamine synthetase
VTQGAKVEEFEGQFAAYTGSKHAIAMCNGTVTLHSILSALEIGPGDEVIVPSLTYISSANVVLYQGAEIRLCECDPKTFNVRVSDLEKVVTDRTKAIITVDLNGLPIDYDAIVAFAKEKDITLIADSAESLGAIYKGETIGSQAFVHSFSFFGNKNLTTGEGGMITTNDSNLASKLRILRNQGQEGRYNHTHLGYNYRMTELSAAVGIAQLKSINERMAGKKRISNRYFELLSDTDGIEMPYVPNYVEQHSWYMFAPSFSDNIDRDKIVDYLTKKGIETRLSFPPIHIQPYYAKRFGYRKKDYPISYAAWSHLINLPISPNLSNKDSLYVIDSLKEVLEKLNFN